MANTEISWMDLELKELEEKSTFERSESLKFEENKIIDLKIDFSKPFESREDTKFKKLKKLIPVTHGGVIKTWWLSPSNPIYKEIINSGKNGQVQFKVVRTGQGLETRYALLK